MKHAGGVKSILSKDIWVVSVYSFTLHYIYSNIFDDV